MKKHAFLRRATAACAIFTGIALSPVAVAAPLDKAPQDVQATNSVLTQNELEELNAFFDFAAVPEEDRDTLLEKLEHGKPWDSLSGAAPVESNTSNNNGVVQTIDRFADGSVGISTVETGNDSDMGFRSVTGCQVVSDVNGHQQQTNCLASVDFGLIQMGFYFDKFTAPGQLGRVTNQYGAHHRMIGGSLSGHRLERFNDQTVRYSADFDVAFEGFPVEWTAWMQVNLGMGNYAYTTQN